MDDAAVRKLRGPRPGARRLLEWLTGAADGAGETEDGFADGAADGARASGPPFLVVLSAHPDDEVVGAGSRLARLRRAVFLTVTDGAPRDGRDARRQGFPTIPAYAAARRRELAEALRLAGINPARAEGLGIPDQEAALRLAALAGQVAARLAQLRPDAVLTHPYEGGHPDHDAAAFAAHAACRLLAGRAPVLLEMTSYHNGPGGLTPGVFLPAGEGAEAGGEAAVRLTPGERRFKRRLLDCFATQRSVLALFPLEQERFRPAPRYDFTRPPHQGPLFYELNPWGMSGDRFRRLAGEALAELGLEGPL